MSQEKVERYKKQKADRKKIMRREKIEHRLSCFVVALVCVAIVGWAGFGIYEKVTASSDNAATVTTEVDLSPITDYLSTQGIS